jgi:glycosyltransferase involved in cell wall biosynthesis
MKLRDVSVIVTSYNDADGIRRCLESVNGFGETLLVDSFSTDETTKIAREFPVTIFRRVSQSAAEQKNWAAERTGAEWVLSLDANEALSRPLREEIEGLDGSSAVGFRARRSIEYLGKVIRNVPRRWARSTFLFAPAHGRFVQRGLHADIELDGKEGALEKPLLRTWHLDVYSHLDTINRETTVAARAFAERRGRLTPAVALIRMLFQPPALFIGQYFLRLGIRDGARGWVFSLLSAYAAFITYAKAWEYGRRAKRKKAAKK